MLGSCFEATLGAPEQSAEATSLVRLNKARAQVAQLLMQEVDNTAPLLTDKSHRISLHRQLRSRYNPSQIPFSALACSRYITANDVARLANVFHQFNLFAVSTSRTEATMESASRSHGGNPILTATQGQGTGGTACGRLSSAEGYGSRSVSPISPLSPSFSAGFSQPRTSVSSVVGNNWRLGECNFRGNGMTLLRDVAEPPPPRVVARLNPLSQPSQAGRQCSGRPGSGRPSSGRPGSGRSSSGRPGSGRPGSERPSSGRPGSGRSSSGRPGSGRPKDRVSPHSVHSLPSSSASTAMFVTPKYPTTAAPPTAAVTSTQTRTKTATTTAAITVADDRDVAESFTTEKNDCAVTMNFLVELLLEMILANFDAANRKGGKVGADDSDDENTEKRLTSTIAQTRSGDFGNSFNAVMNSMTIAGAGHTISATAYQARGCDSRMELLSSAKAELTAWAGQLQQACDLCDHLPAWQQCLIQEDVLERYRLCVVHTGRAMNIAALHNSMLNQTSEVLPMVLPKSITLSPDVAAADSVPVDGVVSSVGSVMPASNTTPQRVRRANVRWRMPDSNANAVAAAEKMPDGRPTSSTGGRKIAAAAAVAPQTSVNVSIPSTSCQEPPRRVRDGSGLTDVLAGSHTMESPVTELAQLLVPSAMETMGSEASALVAGGVELATLTNAGTLMTETNYLTAKSLMCAPELKDLLLHPAELNAFLWESPAAYEIAIEEEMRIQQQQLARSRRSTQVSTTLSVVNTSHSAGDMPRAMTQQETLARGASQLHYPQQQQQQQRRRRRSAAIQHLVCWSDVASNLLMGLETTWTTQQQDFSYVRVATALLEDMTDGPHAATPGQHRLLSTSTRLPTTALGAAAAAGGSGGTANTPGQPGEYEEDEDENSADEDQNHPMGATGKGGQRRRQRLTKTGTATDATTLQQRAMMQSNLGATAEAALRSLHIQAADHVIAAPSQKYIVTSSKDGMVKVWETSHGQFVDTILNVEKAWVLYMCFLHGEEYLLVATSAAEITVVNFPQGGVVMKLRGCTSLATAIIFVKQPSTVNTQRYGMKPGECGHHKPVTKNGTNIIGYHAAAAEQLVKQVESENVSIAARPLIGYVVPTSAYYDEELGHFFFGTFSGMVGCVDLSESLSRSGLLAAAAAGARWKDPLHVYSSVYAHPDLSEELERSSCASPSAATTAAAGGIFSPHSRSALRTTQTAMVTSSGATPAGLNVNGVFYCSVGHCVISCDCAGAIVRTPFATAADSLVYSLGTPIAVNTGRPIRFMVLCPSGRRFVTVHSDRRALLWSVGRATIELVHQYPQEAYDIVDVCFLAGLQQVALLMVDRSIHMYDERGARTVGSIQLPRSLSSRAEDIASVTLKYSANDGEGCLAYLPHTRRIVCGLRGPVLYEPAVRPSLQDKATLAALGAPMTAEDVKSRRGSILMNTRDTNVIGGGPRTPLDDGTSRRGSNNGGTLFAFFQATSAPPSPSEPPSSKCVRRDSTTPDRRPPREDKTSVVSMGSTTSESSDLDDRANEAARLRLRRQMFAAALLKAEQRLLPYQTHTSAVVGVVLDVERCELHTISTDTWTVWNYVTGVRLRTPVQVPDAAERELALRRRTCRLTSCAWSSGGHTRLLLGTRGSRVLTLDAAVGSVVSVTEPLQQRDHHALDDRDVSVIACCGTRTLLCCGRVCEVRRYELSGTPLPTGEERFVSMQVQLPSATAATCVASVESAGAGTKGHGGSGSPITRTHHSASNNSNPIEQISSVNPITTTITSCCVVRESYLCVGTSDTQLFFYRMVDHSSPIYTEVLRDTNGEPDVGRIISLHYVHNKTQDMLLAVVDTGVLYVYSYTLQRTIARYIFPGLGTNLLKIGAPAGRKGRTGPQQSHYVTSVALTDGATSGTGAAAESTAAAVSSSSFPSTSSTAQRQLILCCGDSAGYVHVSSLTSLFADAANAAAATTAGPNAKVALKNRDMRIVASFRAATAGVSAIEVLKWSHLNAATVGRVPPVGCRTTAQDVSSTPPLVLFVGSFDGNVRLFALLPPRPNLRSVSSRLSTTAAAAITGRITPSNYSSPHDTPFSVTIVPETAAPSPTTNSDMSTGPLVLPRGTTPSTRGLNSSVDGVAYTATIFSNDGHAQSHDNTHNPTHSGPSSTLLSPLIDPAHRGTGLTATAPPSTTMSGISVTRSVLSTVNGGTATAGDGGGGRPVPVTVGLCGVDTWDLYELNTFTDVKQTCWLAEFMKQQTAEEEEEQECGDQPMTRLPSILEEKDKHEAREGEARWLGSLATSVKNKKADHEAAGVGKGHAVAHTCDDGAVLLYDVLRRSNKHFSPHNSAAIGINLDSGEDPEHSSAATAQRKASAATVRAGLARRRTYTRSDSDKALSDTNLNSMTCSSGERKSTTALTETARIHSVPPAHAVSAAPVVIQAHTIDELVSGSHISTSKRLALPRITPNATAAAFNANKVVTDLGEKTKTSPLISSRGPQPRHSPFKNQINPLLHTYPVPLLRQMGILHPQDDTPDIDPVTQQPTQLSAQEAIERREKLALKDDAAAHHLRPGSPRSLTSTCSDATSPQNNPLSELHASAAEMMAADLPLSSTNTSTSSPRADRWGRPRRGTVVSDVEAGARHRPTSAVSFLPTSGCIGHHDGEKRDSSSTESKTAVPDIEDDNDNPSSDDENDEVDVDESSEDEESSDYGVEESPEPPDVLMESSFPEDKAEDEVEETDAPAFLTEGPIHNSRSPLHPRSPTSLVTPNSLDTPNTTVPPTNFVSEDKSASSPMKLENKPQQQQNLSRVSVPLPEALQMSAFTISPVTEEANERWNAAQQVQSPLGGVVSEATRRRRSRASCLHTEHRTGSAAAGSPVVPSNPRATRAQRELSLIRSALQDVDPHVLKIRESQMMLSHAAGQLDRSLRRSGTTTTAATASSARRSVLPRTNSSPLAAVPARNSVDKCNDSSQTLGVGEFTSRLLHLWRQRSGDSAIEATAAHLVQNAAAEGINLFQHDDYNNNHTGNNGGGYGADEDSRSTGTRRSVGDSFLLSKRSSHWDRLSSVGSVQKLSHLPSNVMVAIAATRQATPGTSFGLNMLTLMVPSEPPQKISRHGMRRSTKSLFTPDSVSTIAATAAAAASESSSVSPSRSARLLPGLSMRQELHPVHVTLPTSLEKDEVERMLLRRFEAAVNERSVKRQE